MRILVTGGAGYIGSHAVRYLGSLGHEVFVYDNLVYGHRAAVPAGALTVGDLHDRKLLEQTLIGRKIDAVMHFAAFAQVNESVVDPAKYFHNNVVGTLSLLEAMRTVGVKTIVFSSTTATYGVPDRMPITEAVPQKPINPYGYTKLVVEQALTDYSAAYGFSFAALRYFNASGASPAGDIGEDHTPETHLIPLVLQVALGQRDKIMIFGDDYPTRDGTCVRDYIHVDDLASAHALALDKLVAGGPGTALRLNLGIGLGYTVREVVDACRKVTGHAIPAVVAPRREGDPPELVADSSAAKRELGWQPRYERIEEIVETAWRWHKSHPRGYATREAVTA
jgi:UDP-glucose 4-epimerase